jgi:hypothetical protein
MHVHLIPAGGHLPEHLPEMRQLRHQIGKTVLLTSVVAMYLILLTQPWTMTTNAIATLIAIVLAGCGALIA